MTHGIRWVSLSIAMLGAMPAIAQHEIRADPKVEARDVALEAAVKALAAGNKGEALSRLDPLLEEYATTYASEKRQIYCAMNGQETLLYMTIASQQKPPRDAVAVESGWCTALWAKGYILSDQGNVDAAIPFLERAIAMAPQHAHFLSELGYAHLMRKDWPKMLETYQQAASGAEFAANREEELARAWRGMGYALSELGRWDEAEDMYRKCLKLDPKDAKAKSELQWIAEQRAKKH